jgi:hypothetical protein
MVEDPKPEERQFVCAYKICSLKFSRIGSDQAVKFFDDSVIQKRPTIGRRKKVSNVMSSDTVNEWMGELEVEAARLSLQDVELR